MNYYEHHLGDYLRWSPNRFLAPRLIPEKAVFRPALASSFLPGLHGTDMTKMTYREQLLSPFWQRKRLEMLEAAGWECSNCGDNASTLHVHHKRYVKGRMAWEYEPHELSVLCDACHQDEHAISGALREFLVHVDSAQALALLRGYWSDADWFDPWIGDIGRDRDRHTHAIGFVAMLCKGLNPRELKEVATAAAKLQGDESEAMFRLESFSDEFDNLG